MDITTPPDDPRFRQPTEFSSAAPRAAYPIPDGSSLRAVSCAHCQNEIGVSTWEHWNGFLVQCPHCLGLHGKPWHLGRTLLASFFFSFLSFFFTMRPKTALLAGLGLGAVVCVLAVFAGPNMANQEATVAAFLVGMLGPLFVNGAVLVRHQVLLDRAPPRDQPIGGDA